MLDIADTRELKILETLVLTIVNRVLGRCATKI